MSTELIIFIGVLVVGYVAFMVYSNNQSKTRDKSKSKRDAEDRSESIGKTKRQREVQDMLHQSQRFNRLKFHSEKSTTGLIKQVSNDLSSDANEATLISRGGPKRDEYVGTVTLLDGHQSPDEKSSDAVKFKEWIFVGSHSESNLFQQEVELIRSELKRAGWSIETAPNTNNRWFLSR